MDVEVSTTRDERNILYFTCIAHAVTHVYMLVFTAVLEPMSASFGLAPHEFTAYASISTVLFGLGALPSGFLGDRVGEKAMLVGFFFLTAFGGVLVALAESRAALAVAMAVVGLGCSIFHPVGNAMISKGIRHPGKAMGINGLWGSLGTAAGPIFAGQVAHVLDWRWAYLLLTIPTVAIGVWLLFCRLPPIVSGATGKVQHNTSPPAGADHRAVGASRVTMLALLLGAMTFGGLYFHVVTTMLPTYLGGQSGELFPSGLLAGAYLTGVVYAIGGSGQILGGHLVHHREGRGVYILFLGVATPLMYLLSVTSELTLLVTAGLMSIAMFAVQPVENLLLARYTPIHYRGLIFGTKFVLAFGVGGFGTYVSGVVREQYGLPAVFTAAAAMTGSAALLACGAWLVTRRPN